MRARSFSYVCLGILALVVGACGNGVRSPSSSDGQPTAAVQDSQPVVEQPVIEQPAGEQWSYDTRRDEMRGTTIKFASLRSENAVEFDFPYNGGSYGFIILRRRPSDGLSVMLQMDKGQFSSTRKYVSVKFDEGPVRQFTIAEPTDGSTGTVFMQPESTFLKALRKAHRVIIEAQFFQEGPRQMTFVNPGLDPNW